MRRALALAGRGLGRTSPNPPVGAVVVTPDGRLAGEGWHARAGGPHAEVVALAEAGAAARGGTLYVTLEPCAHHGRTPPCVEAILEAGIAAVHYAVRDPNPKVDGRGAAALAAAGIATVEGDCAEEAAELLAPFAHFIRTGRPYVTLKWAMTLDGRIATHTGDSRWVSCPPAREHAHRLRDTHDAVLVGRGTLYHDDPALTVRLPGSDGRQPLRVVLDSRARVTITRRVYDPGLPGATLLAYVRMPDSQRAAFEARGVALLKVRPDAAGRVALPALLTALGQRGVVSLLVEGGAEVAASFLAADLIDDLQVIVAPKLIGSAGALGPVGGRGPAEMDAAARLVWREVRFLGEDVLLRARPARAAVAEGGV
jgi:diaminohydroxyphosphoribosylaminopyrimidine deaminase/5-amino-6-(5-phosphoribosylamino)uracil reductase